MKIRSVSLIGIGVILVVIAIGISFDSSMESSGDTLRVAFFPNIGHAIPVVGMERGTFENDLGNSTNIETKLFDSGPQVIGLCLPNQLILHMWDLVLQLTDF
jgi:NitT/TauT family transport system substrate-binding protein